MTERLPKCICRRLGPVDDSNRCAACPDRIVESATERAIIGHREFHVPMQRAAELGLAPPMKPERLRWFREQATAALSMQQLDELVEALPELLGELDRLALERAKAPLVIVLVRGGIGDVAAYIGIGDAEWVADHGNKLSVDDAVAMFPSIDRARYRP